jgi:thioredoxin 1
MPEITFTDANFATELGTGVALVDFWATWCGPCRAQGPVVEKIAERYAGKARIGKMNVDQNGLTSQRFGITAIPTIILFKGGREVKRLVGLQQERAIAAALDELIGVSKLIV